MGSDPTIFIMFNFLIFIFSIFFLINFSYLFLIINTFKKPSSEEIFKNADKFTLSRIHVAVCGIFMYGSCLLFFLKWKFIYLFVMSLILGFIFSTISQEKALFFSKKLEIFVDLLSLFSFIFPNLLIFFSFCCLILVIVLVIIKYL